MNYQEKNDVIAQPVTTAHEEPLFTGFDEQEEANAGRERNVGTPLAPAIIATEDALTDGDPSDTPFISPITPSLPNTPGPFGR
ncbi:MAG: hypothetical protein H7Y38_04160 [Armatimonadetes bacterium]|nr:hypothetical protein [Armatimonadota bacterium]